MLVTVLNKYTYDHPLAADAFSVMRPSPLGNPFPLKSAGGQYERGQSITLYEEWLREALTSKVEVQAVLDALYAKMLQRPLKLLCCCTPRACHADVVAKILMERWHEDIALQAISTPAFRGALRFLSNYYPSPVFGYPTVEHAFAACKTLDPEQRLAIKRATSPGEAKRLGRILTLRPDWEDIKEDVMTRLLMEKFGKHEHLLNLLTATGDLELVERNNWKDRVWGVVDGEGENRLGKILMGLRRCATPFVPTST